MRYYSLSLSPASGGGVWTIGQNGSFVVSSGTAATFTSLASGTAQAPTNNPYAQNIEIDLPVVPYHTPQGKAVLRVWGVSIQAIGQAANLNGATFSLSGGMSKGLPLANPSQAGVLATGQVFQAFGNWQGINQTIDLVVYPGGSGPNQNISFSWKAGTQLSAGLAQVFAQAFPQYKAVVKIGNIVLPNDEHAYHESLAAFAEYVSDLSVQYGTATYGEHYPGVYIVIQGNTIIATDATSAIGNVIPLAFQDLIGQPTWVAPTAISFKTVMRYDIQIGTMVTFPAAVISPYALTTDAAAYPNAPARNRAVFQGKFFVNEVHHFGNFRQADADSWVTAYTAIPTQAP